MKTRKRARRPVPKGSMLRKKRGHIWLYIKRCADGQTYYAGQGEWTEHPLQAKLYGAGAAYWYPAYRLGYEAAKAHVEDFPKDDNTCVKVRLH